MRYLFIVLIYSASISLSANVMAAGSISLKTQINSTSSNLQETKGTMTFPSDSTFIREHVNKIKNKSKDKSKVNLKGVSNSNNVSVANKIIMSKSSIKNPMIKEINKNKVKQVIQLTLPKNSPKKVNLTTGFVFKDITNRTNN